ncbi:hypothetical protein SK066_16900 [Paenibacillus hunanensis]|uniref:hypothetical protein n=1 Tax=Paenibacillus hunanensis TaxID=539262 RepID=UPI002A6AA4EF|nr:hypothetical protein [Paenibacillus hunanensis]WPP40275.1 hypothetical protein SK066_16900 [Paenibacillus hunanensis]
MTARDSIKAELEIERERIRSFFTAPLMHRGIIVDYVADCSPGCADTIISNAKNILQVINEASQDQWPDIEDWISILPPAFTDSFPSTEDEDDWSLEGWLYWFGLENRFWFLWELAPIGDAQLKISIWIYEHPFPAEAREVLFMKLGTKQLKEINIR